MATPGVEESIISLEELTRQIIEGKVFEEMSHPISIDTAKTQGVEDYFRLQLKSNGLCLNTINRWSESKIKNAYVEGSLTEEAKKDEQCKEGKLESMEIIYPLVDQVELKLNVQLQASGNRDFESTIAAKKMSDECLQLLHSPHKVAEISSHSLLGAEAIVIYLKAGNIVVENDAFDVFDKLTKPMQIYVPGANRGMTSDQYKHNSILEVGPFLIDLYSCCENILMYVTVGERKDVNSLNDIDGIMMFIFDPSGSSLFYDERDLFPLNGKLGDRCFTTIADDASVIFDEYYNDAFNEESVCPFSMDVPILELVVSIQVGIIVKVYDVPSHIGVLLYRELYRVFLEWNGEEILIPTIEKNLIIIKASSELNGEGSFTPKFLIDQNFWWISLIVYFNTVRERGSQLGAYICVAIKLISQEVKSLFSKAVILKEIGESYTRVVIAGFNPLELWLGTCELDGSLLDQSFTQPPRLFWKWIVWRVVSLCLFSWNLLLASSYEMLGVNRVNSVATGTTLITVDLSLESSISFCWDIKKATVVEWPPQNCKWIDNIILAIEFNTTGRQLLWVGYIAALNGDEDDVYFVDKSTEIVISLSRIGDNRERFFINRSWFVYNGNVAGSPGVDMSHRRLVKETYNFIHRMPLGLDVCQRKVLLLASKIEFMEVTNKIYNLKNEDVLCKSLMYNLLWPDCDSFNGWGWFVMVWGVSITLKGVTGFLFSPTHPRDVTVTSSIIFCGLGVACKENEKGYTRMSNKRYNDFKTRKKLMRTKAQPGMLEGSFKLHNSLNLKQMKELLGDIKLGNHPGVFFMIQAVGNACGTIWASPNVTLPGERTEEMEIGREYGHKPRQIRPLTCSHSIFSRAHGSVSWSQGDTKVLAAVYGPKVRIRKNENPENAYIEVVWKLKSWQIGKAEGEYEMILKKNWQSICQ